MKGTVVIKRPARLEEILRSASVMSHHGPTISSSAKVKTQGQASRVRRNIPFFHAIGNKTSVPRKTRRKTMLTVSKCSRARAMKK
jgi:hypothetical protein